MNVAVFYFCVNKSYSNPGFHDIVDKTLKKKSEIVQTLKEHLGRSLDLLSPKSTVYFRKTYFSS